MLTEQPAGPTPSADLRLRRPDRGRVVWAAASPDELIPAGRQARVIWAAVARLDLSAFHAGVKARAGVCGRDATDPALLVALWLYAATRGVGSARGLARPCGEPKPKGQVRVGTTDPDARVMRMGDGGFRPAVNVRLAVDAQSRAILGVAVTGVGSDMGLAPLHTDRHRRCAESAL